MLRLELDSLAEAKPIPRPVRGTWTEEEVITAIEMWAAGKSGAQIASAIGKTRSSILGMAKRNPDHFPPKLAGRTRKPRTKLAAPRIPPSRPKKQTLTQPARFQNGALPSWNPFGPTDGTRYNLSQYRKPECIPVEFWTLTERQCKFPLAKDDEALGPYSPCCGSEKDVSKPYCADHMMLSYPGLRHGA